MTYRAWTLADVFRERIAEPFARRLLSVVPTQPSSKMRPLALNIVRL